MLTAAGCLSRRQRLFASLPAEVEVVLATSPETIGWLSGFSASPFVFRSQGATAALLVRRDGTATLFVDSLQDVFAERALSVEVVQPVWYRCVEAAGDRRDVSYQPLADLLGTVGGARGKVGLEANHCPASLAARSPGFVDVSPTMLRLRRTKDADEIAQIQQCLDVATAALNATRAAVRPGWTELDLFRHVVETANAAAGETVVVYGDFVCGAGSEAGGGPPGRRRVESGHLILLDFSVVIRGYRGDFASTFVCDGEPQPRWRELERACLDGMAQAIPRLRPGVAAAAIHDSVVSLFAERGVAALYPHHTGHGLGLGHPEAPFLVPASDETLTIGDVVTLEPGLYERGVGGMRFEHTFAITADGATQLTSHPLGL
jgi:Xaa-Pro aminopeptidase